MELGRREAPDGAPRRGRSEAACFHLKQRLSLPRNDKFLLRSQRPFPSGCLWLFFMNFSNSLGCDGGASPSRRLPTRLPSVFFPPQDHRLQRRWQNKGPDPEKSAVAVHPPPLPPPQPPLPPCKRKKPSNLHLAHSVAHTHTRHLCCMHSVIKAHTQTTANKRPLQSCETEQPA